jgi:hypothetical protein
MNFLERLEQAIKDTRNYRGVGIQGSDKIFGLTDEQIKDFETKINRKFPLIYKQFLQRCGGSDRYIKDGQVEYAYLNDWFLYNIPSDPNYTYRAFYKDFDTYDRKNIYPQQFVLLKSWDMAGSCYLFDTAEGNDPPVYFDEDVNVYNWEEDKKLELVSEHLSDFLIDQFYQIIRIAEHCIQFEGAEIIKKWINRQTRSNVNKEQLLWALEDIGQRIDATYKNKRYDVITEILCGNLFELIFVLDKDAADLSNKACSILLSLKEFINLFDINRYFEGFFTGNDKPTAFGIEQVKKLVQDLGFELIEDKQPSYQHFDKIIEPLGYQCRKQV